jgi:Fuc2NAc and GlcNAc transferase
LNNILVLSIGIANYLLSFLLVRRYSQYAIKQGLVDVPNERSSHDRVTPRGAGIVFVFLWLCTLCLSFVLGWISLPTLFMFLPGAVLISSLGYWDDIKTVSASARLILQLFIAILSIYALGETKNLSLFSNIQVELGAFGTLLGILGMVWSTNLFNFMDGLDGLAGLQALFVFGLGGFLFWSYGVAPLAWLCWCLTLGVFGFLIWNWPKARVFMGDVGSYFLGFLLALFALVGDIKYQIPIILWIILSGLFWFDATLTLMRRLFRGDKITNPHRLHAYQRLYQAGYSAHQILYGVIATNSILVSMVLWARYEPNYRFFTFGVMLILLSGIYGWIEKKKPMRTH